jgi:hypothetical protein
MRCFISVYISTGGPLDFLWNRFLDTPLFVAFVVPTETEVPEEVKSMEVVGEYHYLS